MFFQSISPGLVKTELFEKGNLDLSSFIDDIPYLKPEDVADSICYVISVPQRVNITELTLQPKICGKGLAAKF